MNNINFANPLLLIIIIPLLAGLIISFMLAINKENRSAKNITSFIIHIVICILITLAFSKTTYEKVITETKIYVLADVSYSSNQNLDLIDEYINNLQTNAPKNSQIGVICFGKDYELLVKPGDELKSVKESTVDTSQTNIKDALEYASTLFEDKVIKRIVIISDGKETNKTNIASIVQSLSSDDIYIDAIYLDNNLKEDTKEVQISQVEYTASTYKNDSSSAYVSIQSNVKTKALLKLYRNNEIYSQDAVTINIGYNAFTIHLDTESEGVNDYKVVIDADTDTSNFNNEYLFTQEVAKSLKVLFISESTLDKQACESLYGNDAEIDYYIKKYDIPYTVEELCQYDEFVLSNVDIRKCDNYSQLVSSIDTLVSEFGKSLVTIGNTYIQNNEDDEVLQSLSDMLPVKYGNDANEKKSVTLLLDISRSMEQIDKLNICKATACEIIDNLSDETMVSIIGFFGEVVTVFTPTPVTDKEELKNVINNLEAYQGTYLGSALKYTYDLVSHLPYAKKEVILISDGLPYREQENASKSVATLMAASNISLSCIHTVNADGAALMKDLAKIGRGYYYFIDSLDEVSSLILDEVLNSLKETVLESSESIVNIKLAKNEIVEGIENLPNLLGLYNNRSKTNANVVLSATYTDVADNSFEIPLYTWWNYGNGKVSTFASTITGDWVSKWNQTTEGQKVLSNFINANKPTERTSSAFIFTQELNGSISNLTVNAPSLNQNATLAMKVTYPDGSIIEKELLFDSQNYVTELDTSLLGKYLVELSYTVGNLSYSSTDSFYVSYLPEYNSFTIYEASNLYYMVSNGGKVSEDGMLSLENDKSNVQKYIFDFTAPFMIASVILFVIDIIIRKLRIEDIKSIFKSKKSLNRKEQRHEKNN